LLFDFAAGVPEERSFGFFTVLPAENESGYRKNLKKE